MISPARDAVVLCGGLGTRLRGHDAGKPKALVPVAGRPFLAWQIDWLRRLGARRVVLAAGFRADQLEAWVRDTELSLEVRVVTEPEALGTAGALRYVLDHIRDHAREHIQGTDLYVANGDTLLPALRVDGALAGSTGAAVMAAVAADRSHTGDRLELDGDRVVALARRTTDGAAWKNGGFYRLRRAEIESWPTGPTSLERDVFPRLAARGELLAHRTSPPLLDMGTPEGRQAMADLLVSES